MRTLIGHRSLRQAAALGAAALIFGRSTAISHAAIDYSSQSRLIKTELFVGGGPFIQELSAVVLGVFDETLSDEQFDDEGGFASASVSQYSTLGNRLISLEGAVNGFGSTDAIGRARSELHATFQIATPSEFRFDGLFTDMSIGESSGFTLLIRLERVAGSVIFDFVTSDIDINAGGDIPLPTVAGVLDPGEYSFTYLLVAAGIKDTSNQTAYSAGLSIVPAPSALAVGGVAGLTGPGRSRRRR